MKVGRALSRPEVEQAHEADAAMETSIEVKAQARVSNCSLMSQIRPAQLMRDVVLTAV